MSTDHCRSGRQPAGAALLFVLAFVCTLVPTTPVGAELTLVFRPPTDAPVLDPFRLPNGPYGAGNRGIEYDTRAGDLIVAAADGTVAFAGAVAGSLFVSVDHPGGLRSTYGFVGAVLVRPGAEVRAGQVVARAAGPFHFTVRLEGRYIDPAPLFGRQRVGVYLVPHLGPQATDSARRGAAMVALHCPTARMGPGRCHRGTDGLTSSAQHPVASASGSDVQPGKQEQTWLSSP